MSTPHPFDEQPDSNQTNPNQPGGAGPYGASPYGASMHAPPPAPKKTNLWLILGVLAVATLPVMCICAGLLLPAVQAAREAARRMTCSNNLKQVGLALHNYHGTYGELPPAYTVDAEGKPMHSWRTLILPFMEQQALYESIDLSKPWDDPANRSISETLVPAYKCPSAGSAPALTQYVAVVDPAGMMTGATAMTFPEVADGLSETLMILEVGPDLSVPWMSPQDVGASVFLEPTATGASSNHVGGTNVLMGDGAVRFLEDSADLKVRKEMLNRGDSAGLTLNYRASGDGEFGQQAEYRHPLSGAVFTAPSGDWMLATGAAAKNYNADCSAALVHNGNAQHSERIGILIIESLTDIGMGADELDLHATASNLAQQMELSNKQIGSMEEATENGVPVVRYSVVGDIEDAGRLRYDCSVLVHNGYLFQVVAFGMAADTPEHDPALQTIHDALYFDN